MAAEYWGQEVSVLHCSFCVSNRPVLSKAAVNCEPTDSTMGVKDTGMDAEKD